MPRFVHAVEVSSEVGKVMQKDNDADSLNVCLKILQDDGAQIIDVKMNVSTFSEPHGTLGGQRRFTNRIYLILYEASEKIL